MLIQFGNAMQSPKIILIPLLIGIIVGAFYGYWHFGIGNYGGVTSAEMRELMAHKDAVVKVSGFAEGPTTTLGHVVNSMISLHAEQPKTSLNYQCERAYCSLILSNCTLGRTSGCSSSILRLKKDDEGNIVSDGIAYFEVP